MYRRAGVRYFLLDRVTELVPGERARGVKCVTLTDETLHDHFPDHPILPGCLVLEGLAQLAGLLVEATFDKDATAPTVRRALLVGVRQAKFHDMAVPGDRLEYAATLGSTLEGAAEVKVEATADGRRVARAELTFVLKEVPSPRVHEQRRALYALWTRDLEPRPVLR